MFKIFLVFIFPFLYVGCALSSSSSSALVPFQHEITASDRYAFNESQILHINSYN